ncbi:hypothetical protein EV714DRAFT_208546 [Schizophyllum commune]
MRPTTLLTLLALPIIALAASITSGQSYKITNSKGGTVVDLSAGDNTSIIGWPYHEGSNQQVCISSPVVRRFLHEGILGHFIVKPSFVTDTDRLHLQWTLDWAGDGWNFRSLSTGKYISLGGADAANGARLVAETDPFTWHIWTDEEVEGAYRIFVPDTHQNFDLYNHGDSTPGTPITTWYTWDGEHQTWQFDEGESSFVARPAYLAAPLPDPPRLTVYSLMPS